MSDALSGILKTREAERLATGFGFTEGPLWHPDGHYYFVDIRASVLYRLTPGQRAEVVRSETGEGNGTTFDLVSLFVEEPFGDFTPASASALLTTDSEVCAADIVVRRFSRAWRPEVEWHGKPCSVR